MVVHAHYKHWSGDQPGTRIVGLPPGTFQVQAVKWLTNVNQNPQTAQRSDWAPFYKYDEDNIADFNPSGQDVPTWRREGKTLVLSWDAVRITTPRFMQVRAIILPPTFGISQTPNTEVVGTALARVIQEFVVYDSALVLASTKNKAIPQIIVKGQADWSERLKRAAQNLNHPRFTQFKKQSYDTQFVYGEIRMPGDYIPGSYGNPGTAYAGLPQQYGLPTNFGYGPAIPGQTYSTRRLQIWSGNSARM